MARDQHDHKHCVAMFEKLSEYIDGELDRAACNEIESHIERCAACKICLATLKTTIHLCGSMSSNPVPQSFSQKLRTLFLENLSSRGGPVVYKR
jgi:anti-sigma factor RsiW